MPRKAPAIALTPEESTELNRLARLKATAGHISFRARIILAAAQGMTHVAIARLLGCDPHTSGHWRKRWMEKKLDGLLDAPRPGQPRKLSDQQIQEVVTATLEEKPKGATHWSTRSMAARMKLPATSIRRIWRAFSLKPHRSETFALSTDPFFVDKVRDVVGLYLNPPENALVLCVDEKAQIQALERTQPIMPLRPGLPERATHDYERHGTTTLFAAWDITTGKVIGQCQQRHRAVEFLKFLRLIDRTVPKDKELHLVLDNYTTHKTVKVQEWLARRPRFHLHFTPTHSSWLNQVERWFGLLASRQIKRGSHTSVAELKAAIEEFIAVTNENPKPFQWVKSADLILERVGRAAEGIRESYSAND
jgi:transposase